MNKRNYLVLVAVHHGAVDDHDRIAKQLATIGCRRRIHADDGKRFALHDMSFVLKTTLDSEALTDLVFDTVRRATLHLAPPEVAVFRFDQASWNLREVELSFEQDPPQQDVPG
ncbi:hypothetical protein [Ralstonia pseudosolanacearum]|uniref:hypothetical protein n=1 Tax=Ralstonia pseudosolanacearum TaxID=1310165 RepID=UPI003CF623F5